MIVKCHEIIENTRIQHSALCFFGHFKIQRTSGRPESENTETSVVNFIIILTFVTIFVTIDELWWYFQCILKSAQCLSAWEWLLVVALVIHVFVFGGNNYLWLVNCVQNLLSADIFLWLSANFGLYKEKKGPKSSKLWYLVIRGFVILGILFGCKPCK